MKQALATDLDGTLIPLDGNSENVRDLKILRRALECSPVEFLFVTGRHFASVANAIEVHDLPIPDWIICDVGTTILQGNSDGHFEKLDAYCSQLNSIVHHLDLDSLEGLLSQLDGLRKQEDQKQGEFKLSYYCLQDERVSLSREIEQLLIEHNAPYSLISSVDPFNGDGLIDLLPKGVSKAYALQWWCQFQDLERDAIVFAGDSGNDTAALTAGFRSILVGNAQESVVDDVVRLNQELGFADRLHVAKSPATSGVLDGCRYFNLIDVD